MNNESEDSLLLLIQSFKRQHNIDPNEWKLEKKYHNPAGFLCRDFINIKDGSKMIVMLDKLTNKYDVIENKNFLYFLNLNEPVFSYATFISHYGQTFLFVLSKFLDEENKLTLGSQQIKTYLINELNKIFITKNAKDKDVVFLDKDLMVLITNHETQDIIDKLHKNKFRFSEKIYDIINNNTYKPLKLDLSEVNVTFPEDENKTSQQCFNTIFQILSKSDLTNEDFIRIKRLLKKSPYAELKISLKTASALNPKNKDRIKELFSKEINKRDLIVNKK